MNQPRSQPLFSISDSTYHSGQPGFIAISNNGSTDVAYSNAKIWEL